MVVIDVLRGESTTSRCACINVEGNWGLALHMNEEDAIVLSRKWSNQVRSFFNSGEKVKEPLAWH